MPNVWAVLLKIEEILQGKINREEWNLIYPILIVP